MCLVLILVVAGAAAAPRTGAAQRTAPPRIVAIGDIHGDVDSFISILQQAQIVDASRRWIGGNTTLVQVGDFTDRGPTVRAVMDLLMELEAQATAAGGRVAVLLGNHELMNLLGDGRDVTPAIYATFADRQSEQRRQAAYDAYAKFSNARSMELGRAIPGVSQAQSRDEWMAAHPLGFVEYREAFSARGRYGRWLRTKPAVLQLNDTVFLHAGINPDLAPRRLEDINRQVLAEIKRFDDYRSRMVTRKLILPFFTLTEILMAAQVEVAVSVATANARASDASAGRGVEPLVDPDPLGLKRLLDIDTWSLVDPNGPMWFRGFATWSPDVGASQISSLLQRYGVAHFVVGHTMHVTKRITPRFSAAVFLIDTGMSKTYVPGGVASALEIHEGRFTAIHAGERTTLLESSARAPEAR
jgi:hypothetical protein